MSAPVIEKNNIATLRRKQGLSQRALAKKADLTQYAVWSAENGKNVTLASLKKIAEALRVKSVKDLY